MLLEGLQLPLTTPFYPNGRINLTKLEHNVQRYSKTPAAGLQVLSDHGEATLLSDVECEEALRAAITAAEPEKVMLAGSPREGVEGTLVMAETAARLGYDGVLVRRPLTLLGDGRERTKELLAYFQVLADRSAIPVVLVSGLAGCGAQLPVEVVLELAAHPQIVGVVESGGETERVARIVAGSAEVRHTVSVTTVFRAVTARMQAAQGGGGGDNLISVGGLGAGGTVLTAPVITQPQRTRSKVVGFQVLAGRTNGMLDALLAGAVGVSPGFAASAPQACYEVYAAWKDGDEALSREKQLRLSDVAIRVEEELGVAGIKFGCDLNGYFGGRPRLPWLPLTGDERTEVERLMEGLRN